jgi:hypothetical protein
MQYILAILGLLLIIGYFISRWIKKKQDKVDEANEVQFTKKQKEFFEGKQYDYKGRKTSADWASWFDETANSRDN